MTYLRAVVVAALVALVSSVSASAAFRTNGRIFVAGDENWTAINDTTTLVLASNIADFLVPGGGGKVLFHIEDSLPWLKGGSFLAAFTNAGNVISYDGGTADSFGYNPMDCDAVVVARRYSNPTVIPAAQLTAYVEAGGTVLVSLGSGLNNDTGVNEATAWNPFLNAFGLSILAGYNSLVGNISILSSDPLMSGVSTLYHNVGSLITLTGLDANARIIATYPGEPAGEGLFATYEAASPKQLLVRLREGLG